MNIYTQNRLPRKISHRMMMLHSCMALTLTLTTAGFLGDWLWCLGKMENFRYHYLIAAILFALIYISVKRWGMVIIALGIAIVNILIIYPQNLSQASPGKFYSSERQIKVVTFNLQKTNEEYNLVRDFLRRENADVVILEEVTSTWKRELLSLSKEYPYYFIREHESFYGLALLSKKPWDSIEYISPKGIDGVPIIKARFRIFDHPFTFLGTKTFPPTSNGWAARRDRQLSELNKMIENIEGSIILAGDLNTTPWSVAYKTFQQESNKPWRTGRITPSWPSLLGSLGIQIDHVMVNSGLQLLSQSSGPYLGSDHRPLIALVGF